VIGHLGTRVSALLDGQLGTEDEERAWAHVHACHQCRDLVEREGWVKTQLAGLTWGLTVAPDGLKGSLLASQEVRSPGDVFLVGAPRRHRGMTVLSGGALGVTVIGLLALGAAPAAAPVVERRTPTTSLVRPVEGPRLTQGGEGRSGGGSRNRAHVASFGAPGVTIPW
jgi:hypothetical protein